MNYDRLQVGVVLCSPSGKRWLIAGRAECDLHGSPRARLTLRRLNDSGTEQSPRRRLLRTAVDLDMKIASGQWRIVKQQEPEVAS